MAAGAQGGCACGRGRVWLASAPLFVHGCHCLNCQRETGSAFVLNALIETDRIELTGSAPVAVAVPTGSGNPHRIYRCEACQVAVWSEYSSPKPRFVRVGALDEPHALKPGVHIYTRSKVPWVRLPEDVLAFEAYYNSKKVWPAESLQRRRAILP